MDKEKLEDEIQAAVGAHGAWKLKLTTAINSGKCDTAAEDIACDNKCAFGQWLYGPELDDATRTGRPYQVTKRVHADFHKLAHDVAILAENGKKAEAFALMDGEYKATSDKLLRALSKWRGEIRAS